jgi:hypothetical protein
VAVNGYIKRHISVSDGATNKTFQWRLVVYESVIFQHSLLPQNTAVFQWRLIAT